MARWLGLFTPTMLAEALHVDPSVGHSYVKALRFHRLVNDTGDYIPGDDGIEEPVLEMDPLPETHYPRLKRIPPHIQAVIQMGGVLLYNQRGKPVRIINESDRRKQGSLPGQRHRLKMRELRHRAMEDAKEERRKESQRKFQEAMQGKKK